MHQETRKSFLMELQSLSESAKKKVLVTATIIIMISIVYVWLGYFNGIIASTDVNSDVGATQPVVAVAPTEQPKQNSFGATIIDGFKGMGDWAVNFIHGRGQYVVEPK
jgi:hypothetical protein